MRSNVPQLLNMNAGRIRFDYLERLQASMKRFEEDIRNAVAMVTDSLRSILDTPLSGLAKRTTTVETLDLVIRNCSRYWNEP